MNQITGPRPTATAQGLMFSATALALLGSYYVYDSVGPVSELLSRQLGFSDTQIGSLNAVYSLPNIFMGLVGGVQVDRFGARTIVLWTAGGCLVGAVLTALGSHFLVMVLGRLLFGLGAETMMVAILVALTQWFAGRYVALFLALNLSVARIGSYLADRSPTFAHSLYRQGWQPPLWLAAGAAALAFMGAGVYWFIDRRATARGELAVAASGERVDWRNLLRFRLEYWYIVGICVTFYSVIFPFRSTFAIKYFQQARGLTLEDASRMNSYVFMAAILAMPVFGMMVDLFGRHALLMMLGSLLLPLSFVCLGGDNVSLWVPTALLGLSFSLVPAVLWPAVARYVVSEQRGTAYGLMAMLQSTGLTLANVFAGHLNDRNLASAAHPQGYDSMLWFFGLLGLMGFFFATLLSWRGREVAVSGGTDGNRK
jgi:MFS family permease